LPDLAHHHEVIHAAPPQRAEAVLPRLGKGIAGGSKLAWNLEPVVGVTARVVRLDFSRHVFVVGSTSNGKMRALNIMIFAN
jgi:hypothetical protein